VNRRAGAALAVLVALVCGGCASLPVSGPIYREAVEKPGREPDAPYFTPPGPARNGTPAAIVSGFLVAMRANPLTTSVAREFLTSRAASTWKPSRSTVVYEAFSVRPGDQRAIVRLSDPRRLDARGGWLGGSPGRAEDLDLRVVREGGQWRIDSPPDALVVPTTYFERSFARYNLYFYDQTGRVLLPDPVFIPRGEQTATSLVRSLHGGPGRTLQAISRSVFPARTTLDLPVVVTGRGVAEVPLSRDVLQLGPADLGRAVDQLAWTLRQVPGIARVRLTVGGAPVPLPGGGIDVSVARGQDLDASGSASDMQMWGLRGGRVVDLESSSGQPAPGRLGEPGYAMRSLAVSDVPRRIAAVSSNGTSLFVAAADTQSGTQVDRLFGRAVNLLRPSFDMFGQLWVVDRTEDGARVYVVRGRQVRELDVAGVTGADVTAMSVARDGSRVAFVLGGSPAPGVRLADVRRGPEGQVAGMGQVRSVAVAVPDGAKLVDVGWRDPTTLAVLARTGQDTSQVTYVSDDGSPVSPSLVDPSIFREGAVALVVAPDGNLPLSLVTDDQRLYTLSPTGQWARSDSKVAQATYGE
jgi:hypothetical protein